MPRCHILEPSPRVRSNVLFSSKDLLKYIQVLQKGACLIIVVMITVGFELLIEC